MSGYIGSKASVVSSGAERKFVFDITATTTSLTGCSYTPNQVHVFHNGVRLVDGTDYTATDGSTVTLTTAAQNGDEVVVISYATFQVADAYTKAEADNRYVNVTGDTMTGNLNIVGTLTSDGADLDGAVVINESGADVDFRVESDTQTHQFWVDAGNNRTVFGGSASNQGDIQYNCDEIWHIAATTTINYATDGNTDSTPNFRVTVDDEGTTKGRMRFYGYTGSIEELMQIQSDVGSTAGGTTGKGVGFGHAGFFIDRGWGNYPAFTVLSTSATGETVQGDIRLHGTNATWASYPDGAGSDFSCGLYMDGSVTQSSDRRYKVNIESISNALDIVKSLDGRRFQTVNREGQIETHRSENNGFKFGFIGQELQAAGVGEIYKYHADDDDGTDGYNKAYAVDYASVTALLVNAIKEQQEIIEALTARVAALEGN